MNFANLTKKQKQYIVLGALGLLIVVAVLFVGIRASVSKVNKAKEELANLTDKIDRADQMLEGKSATLNELGRTMDVLEERMQHTPPDKNNYSWATEVVYSKGRDAGLEIDSVDELRQSAAVGKSGENLRLQTYSVKVTARGSYEHIKGFIGVMEEEYPLMRLTGIEISATKNPDEHAVQLFLQWPESLKQLATTWDEIRNQQIQLAGSSPLDQVREIAPAKSVEPVKAAPAVAQVLEAKRPEPKPVVQPERIPPKVVKSEPPANVEAAPVKAPVPPVRKPVVQEISKPVPPSVAENKPVQPAPAIKPKETPQPIVADKNVAKPAQEKIVEDKIAPVVVEKPRVPTTPVAREEAPVPVVADVKPVQSKVEPVVAPKPEIAALPVPEVKKETARPQPPKEAPASEPEPVVAVSKPIPKPETQPPALVAGTKDGSRVEGQESADSADLAALYAALDQGVDQNPEPKPAVQEPQGVSEGEEKQQESETVASAMLAAIDPGPEVEPTPPASQPAKQEATTEADDLQSYIAQLAQTKAADKQPGVVTGQEADLEGSDEFTVGPQEPTRYVSTAKSAKILEELLSAEKPKTSASLGSFLDGLVEDINVSR